MNEFINLMPSRSVFDQFFVIVKERKEKKIYFSCASLERLAHEAYYAVSKKRGPNNLGRDVKLIFNGPNVSYFFDFTLVYNRTWDEMLYRLESFEKSSSDNIILFANKDDFDVEDVVICKRDEKLSDGIPFQRQSFCELFCDKGNGNCITCELTSQLDKEEKTCSINEYINPGSLQNIPQVLLTIFKEKTDKNISFSLDYGSQLLTLSLTKNTIDKSKGKNHLTFKFDELEAELTISIPKKCFEPFGFLYVPEYVKIKKGDKILFEASPKQDTNKGYALVCLADDCEFPSIPFYNLYINSKGIYKFKKLKSSDLLKGMFY